MPERREFFALNREFRAFHAAEISIAINAKLSRVFV
jgi:hypothetical protein